MDVCFFIVLEEFDNYMQQDAHEFLNFLINHINEIILGEYTVYVFVIPLLSLDIGLYAFAYLDMQMHTSFYFSSTIAYFPIFSLILLISIVLYNI